MLAISSASRISTGVAAVGLVENPHALSDETSGRLGGPVDRPRRHLQVGQLEPAREFDRVVSRRGPQKANVAIQHPMLSEI